jgi:hypothetical protein
VLKLTPGPAKTLAKLYQRGECTNRAIVGMRLAKAFLWELCVFGEDAKSLINTGEKNGGDDETRTRDLCRDRAAF